MTENFEQISRVSGFMHHNGGLYFREVSENEYEFKAIIKEFHLNKRQITHGGFICSLIDAGAGTAVYRASNNQSCVTVSLDVKFIAPSKLGDEIVGKVNILKKTKSMLFINCNLFINKNIIASATGVWKVIKKI
tara:strand:+ start:82 stop:483 length:402 start_codon:yes stop_codon:yes gene_type:complete